MGKVLPQYVDNRTRINGGRGDLDEEGWKLKDGVNYEVDSKDRETVTLTEWFKVVGSRGESNGCGGVEVDIVNERLVVVVANLALSVGV